MKSENYIELIGVRNIPIIKNGDNIAEKIVKSLKKDDIVLQDKDILVIAQSIVSKSNGRIKNLDDVTPSEEAKKIYNEMKPKAEKAGIPLKSPSLIQVILDESKEVLRIEHVLIVETKDHGFVCANAGVDQSNVEGDNNVTLLPKNPDNDAEKIRREIKNLANKDVATIISDSFGRPFRVGSVGAAIGVAGLSPILDKRGCKDLFGYELQTTIIGHADNLASAAQLVMGESNEGVPVVVIRGYDFEMKEGSSIQPIIREVKIDIFRS